MAIGIGCMCGGCEQCLADQGFQDEEESMSASDEMSSERNREIANDNYYDLRWLNAAVAKFLAKLDEARESETGTAKVILDQVNEWTAEMRRLQR